MSRIAASITSRRSTIGAGTERELLHLGLPGAFTNMTPWPPEKLEAQVIDLQHSVHFQFLTSLLRFGSGWFANQAQQRTRERCGCHRSVPWPGSLSSGR